MSLKERYLEERKRNQVSIETVYEYFLEKKGADKAIGFNLFMKIMSQVDSRKIIEQIDAEYNVVRLETKDGVELLVF